MLTDVYGRSLAGQITKADAMALVDGDPFKLFSTADALRMEDKITAASGGKHGEHLTREQMAQAIRAVGRVPRERNTVYEYVPGN
jgi:hypothetical protein